MIEFKVDGEPKPKQSFRVFRNGKTISGFTDVKVKHWQNAVSYIARMAMMEIGAIQLIGDLRVHLLFELSNRRRIDLDNLSKGVLDACNNILWADDSSIVELCVKKIISKTPGVTVKAETI